MVCINNKCNFCAVYQIHFTGSHHLVTSTCFGKQVQLQNSNASLHLSPCMKTQLAQIYQLALKNNMPVQQQQNDKDCGLFAIAYAFHAALGDDVIIMHFDISKMRQHLIYCLDRE